MKTAKRLLWLGLAIGALTATSANAALIRINPSTQDALSGADVFADIVISELDEDEVVGGVSLLLSFDSSILRGVQYILDPTGKMGAALLDLSGGFGAGGSSPLDLFFLADVDPTEEFLHALQGDGFVAATIKFLAVGDGLSPLNLSVAPTTGVFLSDYSGFELATVSANGSVCVGEAGCDVVEVPEPGALSLLGLGLLGLLVSRQRRQGTQLA